MRRVILLILDILTLTLAFLAAYYLRSHFGAIQSIAFYWEVYPVVIILFLLIFGLFSLYKEAVWENDFLQTYQILRAFLVFLSLLMVLSFLQKVDYSRAVLLLFVALAVPLIFLERSVMHKAVHVFGKDMKSLKNDFHKDLPNLNLEGMNRDFYDSVKAVFDYLIALIAAVLLLPLWLIIGLIIKLDSEGGIIFKHKRVGKDGKKFYLYKFRTMHENTNPQAEAPLSIKDERITRFGRFLRRTSLDEAPQFINILRGEMALIGPRPEMPFIAEQYNDWQSERLKVKPGITGLWQVLGRKDIPLNDNLEYDFYYIKNRSFLLDVVILIKTVGIVIRGKGAY